MKTKDITLIALLLAILIVCSQLAIPIGVVPITLQTFAVLLIGLILPPKQAALTTTLYLIAGLIGFPIFSGASGGFQSILSPSFGFIIGYIPASYLTSLLSRQLIHQKLANVWATLAGSVIIYIFGILYFIMVFNFIKQTPLPIGQVLSLTLIPFIPGDILKMILAIIVDKALTPIKKRYFA